MEVLQDSFVCWEDADLEAGDGNAAAASSSPADTGAEGAYADDGGEFDKENMVPCVSVSSTARRALDVEATVAGAAAAAAAAARPATGLQQQRPNAHAGSSSLPQQHVNKASRAPFRDVTRQFIPKVGQPAHSQPTLQTLPVAWVVCVHACATAPRAHLRACLQTATLPASSMPSVLIGPSPPNPRCPLPAGQGQAGQRQGHAGQGRAAKRRGGSAGQAERQGARRDGLLCTMRMPVPWQQCLHCM